MHRINLRGRWNLAAIEHRLEASRKFHAPPGFVVDERRSLELHHASKKNSETLSFLWQTATDWPIHTIRCNGSTIVVEKNAERQGRGGDTEREIFVWDAVAGVGRIPLNGILRPYNEIVLVWQRWPSTWESLTGRYTPDPLNPIHFDSWLEIQT